MFVLAFPVYIIYLGVAASGTESYYIVVLLLHNLIEPVSGPPRSPEDMFLNVSGPGLITLSWPPTHAYFNETLTYELHKLKDDGTH